MIAGVLASFVVSALLLRPVRDFAIRRALLDRPNDRSSHSVPKPRLGGLAVVIPMLGFGTALVVTGAARAETLIVLGATGGMALLGLVDDLRPLPVGWRFGIQTVLAVATVAVLRENLPAGAGWFGTWLPAWVLGPLAVLWILWLTNLYNFMDGIDGLAGGQAVILSLGLALAAATLGAGTTSWLLLSLAAASLGFLAFNFPPASIFMGDVGSTALGFFFGSLPLVPASRPVAVEVVALGLSLFLLDATTTLIRRVARGERWYAPHRTHLYQRPVVLGVSHRAVTLVAYCGMAVVSVCAGLWPVAGDAWRVWLFSIPVTLFLAGHAVVRGLERGTERTRARGQPRSEVGMNM